MAGKNIPKVSFNGIEKNNWIEGKDSYARMYDDPGSTHIKFEMLTQRGISSRESPAAPPAKEPADFVSLGKVNLKIK